MTRFLVVILLAGCAAQQAGPRDPVIVAGPEVRVAVRERCHVEIAQEPRWAVEGVLAQAAAENRAIEPLEASKAVLAELEQRRNWLENVVKPAIRKCE